MIRVTVELWPGGFEAHKSTLATVDIANVSGLAPISDYRVWVHGRGGRWLRKRGAMVRGHARNSLPVLTLVRKALQAARY